MSRLEQRSRPRFCTKDRQPSWRWIGMGPSCLATSRRHGSSDIEGRSCTANRSKHSCPTGSGVTTRPFGNATKSSRDVGPWGTKETWKADAAMAQCSPSKWTFYRSFGATRDGSLLRSSTSVRASALGTPCGSARNACEERSAWRRLAFGIGTSQPASSTGPTKSSPSLASTAPCSRPPMIPL